MKILPFVLLVVFAVSAHAQISIDSMLMRQPETKSELINKARNVIIDALDANDRAKVKELQRYLNANYEKSSYVALYPSENILLYYWCTDYDSILAYVGRADTLAKQVTEKSHPTAARDLYSLLHNKIIKNKLEADSSISASSRPEEQKEFLHLCLDYYLIDAYSMPEKTLDSALRKLRTEVKQFKDTYPNSVYKEHITVKGQEWSKWGITMGMGGGYGAYTGRLTSDFNNIGAMFISFGASYKNLAAEWNIFLGGSDTKKEIVKQGVPWIKGSYASYVGTSLTVGWRFFERSRILITPFTGIGASNVSPSEPDEKDFPALKDVDYTFGPIVPLGVHADLRLGKMKNVFGQNLVAPSFYTLRLSYTFNYQGFSSVPSDFSGNMHLVTLGFAIFGRGLKTVTL